jgi:hypothetical protein
MERGNEKLRLLGPRKLKTNSGATHVTPYGTKSPFVNIISEE